MSGYVDFHHVEPHQRAIHDRLVNWAIWCADRRVYWIAPMFRNYRSTDQWHGAEAKMVIDTLDAQALEKAVSALPIDHCAAVRWCYVYRTTPISMARRIGCTLPMLQKYLRDGRQMLLNRLS